MSLRVGQRISEYRQAYGYSSYIPCGTKFLRVLIFAIFPAIRYLQEVPANKNYLRHFSHKNLLQSRSSLSQIRYKKIHSKKSCLFNHNLSLSFRNKTAYPKTVLSGLLFENMYFCCTYSIKTKILSMLGTGYFLKIVKIDA